MQEEYSLFSLDQAAQKRRFSMRRSHLEIRMDILYCVKSGAEKPTQIMYKANLSWGALKEHLAAREGGKLLAEVEYGTRRRYEVTERGATILMAYDKIVEEINKPFQKAAVTY